MSETLNKRRRSLTMESKSTAPSSLQVSAVRSLFIILLGWQFWDYLLIPSPVPLEHLHKHVVKSVSIEEDRTNWRAVAGETLEGKRLRQSELSAVVSGDTLRLACQDIGQLCLDLARTESSAEIALWVLPKRIQGRSWAMRIEVNGAVVADERLQGERLRSKKRVRTLLIVLISVFCVGGVITAPRLIRSLG
jgi:hypothetical protein